MRRGQAALRAEMEAEPVRFLARELDFLVDRLAIAGAPDECAGQIRRAMSAGARQFAITGFVPGRRRFMRRWMGEAVALAR